MTLFDKDKNVVDCACNIQIFIAKVLIEAPSVKEKNSRVQCHHEELKNISIAEINSKPILTDGLHDGLQKSIDMFFNKEISCKKCGNKVQSEVNPEVHLLIDVEHAYHSTLLAIIEWDF